MSFFALTNIQLEEGASPASLEAKFDDMVANYAAAQVERTLGTSFEDYIAAGNGYRYYLRPISSVHLDLQNIEAKFLGSGNKTFVFILTSIGISTFIIAGAAAMLIAWITVSYQSLKAAIVNPVDSLSSD